MKRNYAKLVTVFFLSICSGTDPGSFNNSVAGQQVSDTILWFGVRHVSFYLVG